MRCAPALLMTVNAMHAMHICSFLSTFCRLQGLQATDAQWEMSSSGRGGQVTASSPPCLYCPATYPSHTGTASGRSCFATCALHSLRSRDCDGNCHRASESENYCRICTAEEAGVMSLPKSTFSGRVKALTGNRLPREPWTECLGSDMDPDVHLLLPSHVDQRDKRQHQMYRAERARSS